MDTKLPKKVLYAYLAILGATAIWGAALPITKLILNEISVFNYLYLRFLTVAIIMLPVAAVLLMREKVRIQDIPHIVFLGIMSQSFLIILSLGLNLTTSIDTAILNIIAPIIVIAAGHYFYKEKINALVITGVIIATIGTFFVAIEPFLSPNTSGTAAFNRVVGNTLVIGYNFSFAAYIIVSRQVMGHRSKLLAKIEKTFNVATRTRTYSPLLITTLSFYIGLISVLPFFLYDNFISPTAEHLSLSAISAPAALGVLYMAIFSSVAAYFLFEWAVDYGEVADTAIFGYLGPLFTIPFSFWILGETPTTYAITGAVIIFLGVLIAEKYKS